MSLVDTVNPPEDPFGQIAAMVDRVAERVSARHYRSRSKHIGQVERSLTGASNSRSPSWASACARCLLYT